jgi:hypothetical protein
MERTRAIAVKLVDSNIASILQKGKVVDAHNFKGPIRLQIIRKVEDCIKLEGCTSDLADQAETQAGTDIAKPEPAK